MLRDEIVNFTEGDGLVAPQPNPSHTYRTCDNGTMFMSEFYMMLAKSGQLTEQDKLDYASKIRACYVEGCPGLVARAPGDRGDTDPDDYHAIFAACVVMGLKDLGKEILGWGLAHKGSYNPTNPTVWTGASCLFRMLQLLCAGYCASGSTPFYMWPLFTFTATIIATSCMKASPGDADSRRLSWSLIQAVSPYSALCRAAASLWFARLAKDYPNGKPGQVMREVALVYYQEKSGQYQHPFIKFWVD